VIVVPAMNSNLAAHPQMARSLKTLRDWGVGVLKGHAEGELLIMASVEEIVATVGAVMR
jgi:phosphopantothenoylcysteine synthetase/decarboxylase